MAMKPQGEPVVAVAANLIDVTKTFGPTVALDRVSLQAFEGEVHAIIGGNGSGKSTLAKVISGVLLPDSGQISIFGKSATTPAESKALGISNVYQEVLVADECSILDNLFLALTACSKPLSRAKSGISGPNRF